jgi:hypothetical protein
MYTAAYVARLFKRVYVNVVDKLEKYTTEGSDVTIDRHWEIVTGTRFIWFISTRQNDNTAD